MSPYNLDVRLHLKQRRYGDAKKDDLDTRNDRDRSTTTLCRLLLCGVKVRNIRMGFHKSRVLHAGWNKESQASGNEREQRHEDDSV